MPAFAAWRRLALAIPVLLVTALALSLLPVESADAATRRQRKIHHSWEVAGNQKGDPYRYGANGPHAFDCSGLTQFAYKRAGLYLPRTADAQARYTRNIKRRNMRRGDLIFIHSGGDVYHVSMFAGRKNGNVMVIHSSQPGTNVKRDPMWTNSWFPGTLRRR